MNARGHSCACPTGVKLLQDARTCEQGKNRFKLASHLDIAACLGIILLLQLEMQVHFSGEEALTGSILQVITIFDFQRIL